MTKILAIDDPRMSESLLSAIRHWCDLTGATARILSVVDESVVRDTTRAIGVVGKVSSAVKEDFIKEKEKIIKALLFNAGYTPEDGISVRAGNLLEEIRREVDLYKPDLVITTSRLRGGMINIVDAILKYAEGNILILPGPFTPGAVEGIALALESTDVRPSLLHTAVSLSRRYGGQIHIIVPVEVNEQVLINAPEMVEKEYAEAKRRLKGLEEKVAAMGVPVKSTLREGSFAEVVSRIVADTEVDLILTGPGKATGGNTILQDSEAGSLIRRVDIPVLVCKKDLSF